MLSLKKFISSIESINFVPGVIICTSSSYSSFFFSQLIAKLKKQLPIQSINISSDYQSLVASLQTSFLGNSQVFFLNNLSNLSGQAKKDWFAFLTAYKGPHILICYYDQKDISIDDWPYARFLELLFDIEKKDYQELVLFLFSGFKISKNFENRLFSNRKSISLDSGCLVAYYHVILGRSIDHFFSEWIELILGSKNSLFTLSQYFFAKNALNFFILWKKISQDFPTEFWTAYWSEQLWQAKIFLNYATKNRAVEGRRYASRLPFSFFQRDWRKSKESELVSAHNFISLLDYNIKNGNFDAHFELFYFKFFAGQFV